MPLVSFHTPENLWFSDVSLHAPAPSSLWGAKRFRKVFAGGSEIFILGEEVISLEGNFIGWVGWGGGGGHGILKENLKLHNP